jgi:hypothetical protein
MVKAALLSYSFRPFAYRFEAAILFPFGEAQRGGEGLEEEENVFKLAPEAGELALKVG